MIQHLQVWRANVFPPEYAIISGKAPKSPDQELLDKLAEHVLKPGEYGLPEEEDRAVAVLSDGSEEELDLATVKLRDGVAYATVKGRFDARLSTAAWTTLGERIVERDGAFWLGDHKL